MAENEPCHWSVQTFQQNHGTLRNEAFHQLDSCSWEERQRMKPQTKWKMKAAKKKKVSIHSSHRALTLHQGQQPKRGQSWAVGPQGEASPSLVNLRIHILDFF